MLDRSCLPASSMKVTADKRTEIARPAARASSLSQHCCSSSTHGPATRPSTSMATPAESSVTETFSIVELHATAGPKPAKGVRGKLLNGLDQILATARFTNGADISPLCRNTGIYGVTVESGISAAGRCRACACEIATWFV